MAQVQVLGRRHFEGVGHGHAFAVVQQGDRQVVGHALLVVGEEHMAAGGEVGFLHQLLQVLHGLAGERREVATAVLVLLQPAAERVGAGLLMEETPGLALLGVVAFVEVGQQVFHGLGLAQFAIPGMQHGGAAVGLLVDEVDDAMADGHGRSALMGTPGARAPAGKVRQFTRPDPRLPADSAPPATD
ncbi:hypothetical protein D9M69_318560 [compost metagenome]